MGLDFQAIVETISSEDRRYKSDAYAFVMEALSYTQKKYKTHRHVSADEILSGMRELLLNKYGAMAITVLEYWGIKTTEDFGNIIFNLIDRKILSKTDADSIETFRDAYDFKEVFLKNYRKQLAKKISRMRAF